MTTTQTAPHGILCQNAIDDWHARTDDRATRRLLEVAPYLLHTLEEIRSNLTGRDHFPERVADSLRRADDAIKEAAHLTPPPARGPAPPHEGVPNR